jgi:hypothetical protein
VIVQTLKVHVEVALAVAEPQTLATVPVPMVLDPNLAELLGNAPTVLVLLVAQIFMVHVMSLKRKKLQKNPLLKNQILSFHQLIRIFVFGSAEIVEQSLV